MGCKTGFRDLRTYYFFSHGLRIVVHYLPTNKKNNKKRLAWEERRNNLELQVNEIRFAFAIFSWVTHTRELLTWHAYRNFSAVNDINKLSHLIVFSRKGYDADRKRNTHRYFIIHLLFGTYFFFFHVTRSVMRSRTNIISNFGLPITNFDYKQYRWWRELFKC